jgi:hypothetical protein
MDIFATVSGKRSRGIAAIVGCRDLPDIPADESPDGPFGPRWKPFERTTHSQNICCSIYAAIGPRIPDLDERSSSLGRA